MSDSIATSTDDATLPRAPILFALGQLALLAVVPASATVWLVSAELALLVAFGLAFARTAAPIRSVVAYVGLTALLAGLAVAGWRVGDALSFGAALLVGAAATLAYGLHRYELVRLGLLAEAP